MILSIYQKFRSWKPKFKGFLFKLLFNSSDFQIGKNFSCETFPEFIKDKTAQIIIGDDVIFRRNVELRAHKNSVVNLGNNIRIDRGVRILASNDAKVDIKDGVRIGLYSVLNGGDSITVGLKSLISGFVYLQTSIHNHKVGSSIQDQGYSHKPVLLENDVWLGAHVVVLPGVILGEGAVVGSNAVVTKSVASFKVVSGVPAKELKERV